MAKLVIEMSLKELLKQIRSSGLKSRTFEIGYHSMIKEIDFYINLIERNDLKVKNKK